MRNNHQSACLKGTPAGYNALNDTQDFITVMLIHLNITYETDKGNNILLQYSKDFPKGSIAQFS